MRHVGLVAGVAVAAVAALGLGLAMPRGPMATGEALAWMVAGIVMGLCAGFVSRSRWAMLVAPVTFIIVFELVRLGERGPTVDGIHLSSTYGVLAFVTGRGLDALLVLLPMLVGASYGAAWARRRSFQSGRLCLGLPEAIPLRVGVRRDDGERPWKSRSLCRRGGPPGPLVDQQHVGPFGLDGTLEIGHLEGRPLTELPEARAERPEPRSRPPVLGLESIDLGGD